MESQKNSLAAVACDVVHLILSYYCSPNYQSEMYSHVFLKTGTPVMYHLSESRKATNCRAERDRAIKLRCCDCRVFQVTKYYYSLNIVNSIWAGRLGLDSHQGRIFLLVTELRLAVGSTHYPIQWLTESFPRG